MIIDTEMPVEEPAFCEDCYKELFEMYLKGGNYGETF